MIIKHTFTFTLNQKYIEIAIPTCFPNCLTFTVLTLFPPPSLLSLLPPQPPVVKTEMVTISDTFAAQKTEIATKEVPIVHTETKTITYEAAQVHI